MKIKYLLFIIILTAVFKTYSLSPRVESFSIVNNSSINISIDREFREGLPTSKTNYMWIQKVDDTNIVIKDFISIVNKNIIHPGEDLCVIEYFPSTSIEDSDIMYTKIDDIPFINKINAIFKSFILLGEDGKVLLTLEDLYEKSIKKKIFAGETAYTIEIFDFDFTKKYESK